MGDGESAAQLAGALWRYWDVGGFLGEGRSWLNAALAASPTMSLARAKALTSNGYLALLQGDVISACALLEEGLTLSRELSDEMGVGTALIILGMAARARGSLGLAEDLLQEALSMARRSGHRLGTYSALYLLASVADLQGDHERALALHHESLELKREHGDVWGIAVSLSSLATLAQERGEADRACGFLKESLELRVALHDRDGIADCLDGLAREASGSGSDERAALLCGAAEALRESIGLVAPPHASAADSYLEQTRTALGEEEFATAWSRGRALPVDLAITLAVATDGDPQPASVGVRTTGRVKTPEAVVITHRGGSGTAAVLFVHGFNAKPRLTWGSFPELLMADARLGDWDIFSVGYPTSVQFDLASIWTADPPLVSVADNLRVVASLPPLRQYRRLGLVAHSMGGLVVQRALVDDDEFAARAGHVFLFACPSLGSRKAGLVRLWKRQLRDMARGSMFIADLRERWTKKFSAPPFYFKAVAGDVDEFCLAPYDPGALPSPCASGRPWQPSDTRVCPDCGRPVRATGNSRITDLISASRHRLYEARNRAVRQISSRSVASGRQPPVSG